MSCREPAKTLQPANHDAARQITSARVFPHPRAKVFRAVTDGALLAQWWGPDGFTNTFEHFDPRPGGAWRFTMHGPDGTDYYNESEFVEVTPPDRITLIHLRPMHRFRLEMTFAEEAGQTRLTWLITFDDAAERERMLPFIPAANEQNFDRLAVVLATMK